MMMGEGAYSYEDQFKQFQFLLT